MQQGSQYNAFKRKAKGSEPSPAKTVQTEGWNCPSPTGSCHQAEKNPPPVLQAPTERERFWGQTERASRSQTAFGQGGEGVAVPLRSRSAPTPIPELPLHETPLRLHKCGRRRLKHPLSESRSRRGAQPAEQQHWRGCFHHRTVDGAPSARLRS